MRREDLQNYMNKHCRFRFRGGKMVYGVIWETEEGLFFASKDGHDAMLQMSPDSALNGAAPVARKTDLMPIDHDIVMAAEVID